jgi:hypothetical protein
MSKLKQLEIKKLMKELDFIESDFTYKSEIVHEADNNFIKSVNELLEKHPLLKEVFDKKINSKIDNIFQRRSEELNDKIESINESNQEAFIEEEEVIVEKVIDKRVRKLYREIAKITHPDRIDNKKLNDLYIKATHFYDNNDIAGTYSICNELDIDYEPDESDNELISNKINGLKNRISFIESTLTWVWYHSTDNTEKEQMILRYIKNQLDN